MRYIDRWILISYGRHGIGNLYSVRNNDFTVGDFFFQRQKENKDVFEESMEGI